jgi:hypothetical protein
VILYFLWRSGLVGRAGRDKFLFFLGATENALFLSRRWPLWTAINWFRAVISPSYARAVVSWLTYRVELYDGQQG